MEGNDWNTCRENVFQIFRAHGHGDVAVGDLIGLYLTKESGKWFDCSQTDCRKSSCPGIASYEYGFDIHVKSGTAAMDQSSRYMLKENSWVKPSLTKMTSCCSTSKV